MGGDDSQKLLPWRGIRLLSGAQKTSGSQQHQHSSSAASAPAQWFQRAAIPGWSERETIRRDRRSGRVRTQA
jgi:hypothetical protein